MGGATLVGIGILASRLAGIVRTKVIAYYFGIGLVADIFTWASKFPNFLQNLLGEGALSASFIPVYAELVEKGRRDESGRVAGAVLALLVAAVTGIAGLSMVLLPFAMPVLTPKFDAETRALAVTSARLILPSTAVLVLSAWALGVQNAHRKFLMSYLAPVASSVAVIAAVLIFGGVLGWTDRALLLAALGGTFVGAVLQLLVQLPTVLALEPALKIRFDTGLEGVRTTLRNAGPTVAGRGVVQLSSWLDLWLALLLAAGGASSLGFAQQLYMLPISLFGVAIVAAELPELARQREDASGAIRTRINAAMERALFYVVPSTVAFLVLGPMIGAGALGGREFGSDDARLVGWILRAYAIGLVASTLSRVASSAFYALQDSRTPAVVAGFRVALSAVAAVLFMVQLEPVLFLPAGFLSHLRIGDFRLGAVGIAAGTSIAAWAEWAILRRRLAVRIGPVGPRLGVLARIGVAAAAGGAAGFGVEAMLPANALGAGWVMTLAYAALCCSAFGLVYLAVAAALRVEEVTSLLGRVRGRRSGGSGPRPS
ncbi:MAG: murein biosynthesis integral membrane protein MurJ [Deltaproteobacteria bacterium]|nr:murein biosynthesis integral membrane protein MurJ [Deltaproteobacteria bacterium]